MKEYIEILENWVIHNKKVVLARVIKTWGSSPRPVGSIMLVNEDGKIAGSVSGGCVEGVVVKNALEVLKGKESIRLSYGVSDEEAWSVGLSCGGSIQVFVEKMPLINSPVWHELIEGVKNNKSSILISSLEEGGNTSTLITEEDAILGTEIDLGIIEMAKGAYKKRMHQTVSVEEKEYFIQVFPRKPQLLVIGAAHITVDLVALAHSFDFETIVIDPRGYFTENVSFLEPPSQIYQTYPSEILGDFPLDAYVFAAILSHDPKIDDNALEVLLPSKVAYIGALGSKKTHAKRTARLLEKGIAHELIDKIKAPIGLNIKACSAKEIALAIMAQIIAVKNAEPS